MQLDNLIEESATRYRTLIQPIRDLAQNWDIDIAEELEGYLEELESLQISINNHDGHADEEGNSNLTLNFAEAALLIQGSTAIYSKKVEYLYQLVLQSLEFITNKNSKSKSDDKKNRKQKDKSDLSHISDDEMILYGFGNDISYLLLDDIIQVGQNIDIKQDKNKNHLKYNQRQSVGTSSSGVENSRISISLMNSILNDDHGNTTLKLTSSVMDGNGALVIGGFAMNQNQNISLKYPNNSLNLTIESRKVEVSYTFDMMNPHEVVGGSKKIEKKRSYRIPTLTNRDVDPWLIVQSSFITSNQSSNAIFSNNIQDYLKSGHISNNKKNILFDPALLPLFKANRRRDNMNHNNNINQNHVKSSTNNEDIQYYNLNRRNHEIVNEDNDLGNNYDDDVVDDDNYDCDIPDNYIPNDDALNINENNYDMNNINNENDNNNDLHVQLSPLKNYRHNNGFNLHQHLLEEEEIARRVEIALNEELFSSEGANNTYEMICRKHINSFLQGAEKYARETQLSQRVSEWTKRLEPILREQEAAPQYDIHKYSDSILVKFGEIIHRKSILNTNNYEQINNSNEVRFDEVAKGHTSAEVCRIFLACLQLVNIGNLAVVADGKLPIVHEPNKQSHKSNKSNSKKQNYSDDNTSNLSVENTFTLKLLSETRNQHLDNFLAPSVKDMIDQENRKNVENLANILA
eukprot:gene12255-16432_t